MIAGPGRSGPRARPACSAHGRLRAARQSVPDRGAEASAPRSTPLTLVSGAVAGDDLQQRRRRGRRGAGLHGGDRHPGARRAGGAPAGFARRRAVARDPRPRRRGPSRQRRARARRNRRRGARSGSASRSWACVAAAGAGDRSAARGRAERRAWLEAAAAAASVTALIRSARETALRGLRRALLQELTAGPPDDPAGFLAARADGLEPGRRSGGALRPAPAADRRRRPRPRRADREDSGIAGHELPAAGSSRWRRLGSSRTARSWPAALREQGLDVALSAPRRDPRRPARGAARGRAPARARPRPRRPARRAGRDLPAADRGAAARSRRARDSCASGRSRPWPTTTPVTTPTCWRPCRPSWPTTARPPRPPRRWRCTATRSATGFPRARGLRPLARMSQTAASGSASGSRPIRS